MGAKTSFAADQAERESQIIKLAPTVFGNAADAMIFLNAEENQLSGRPIEIAASSHDGFLAVEGLLSKRAGA